MNWSVPPRKTNGPFSIIAPVKEEQPGPPLSHNIRGAAVATEG